MPKARRKHPGFESLKYSPQGRGFTTICFRVLGSPVVHHAIETIPDVGHIFFLDGPDRFGFVIEAVDERAHGGVFIGKTALLTRLGEDELLLGEITTHRWDAWAEASETGDRSLIDGPRKKMYAVRDQKSADLGARKDKASFVITSVKRMPRTIAGIPTPQVLAVRERVEKAIASIECEMREGQRLIDQGQSDQSLSHWIQAVDDAGDVGRASLKAGACFGASSAYGLLGRLEEDQTFLRRAATIYENIDMPAEAGNAYANLASVLATLGRHDESLSSWQRAIGLLEQAGQTHLRARTHWGWARSLTELGDTDAAAAQYLRARIAFEDCGNYDSALEVHAEMTTVNKRS